MQVLNYVSQFGTLALIVATIERYRSRHDSLWRVLFIAVLISEVFWGLISGMKGLVLQNFLVVALVSSFVMRKLNLRWFVILFFGLVLFYPFFQRLSLGVEAGEVEVTSFGGAAEAGQMAFSKIGGKRVNRGRPLARRAGPCAHAPGPAHERCPGALTGSSGEHGERQCPLVDASLLSLRSTVPLAVQTDSRRRWMVHRRSEGRLWRRCNDRQLHRDYLSR